MLQLLQVLLIKISARFLLRLHFGALLRQQFKQNVIFFRIRVSVTQELLQFINVDHLRDLRTRLLLFDQLRQLVGLFRLRVLLHRLVGYVVKLLQVVLIMVVSSLLAHADVLTNRQVVSAGRIYKKLNGFLKQFVFRQVLALQLLLFILFRDSLHLSDGFGVLEKLSFILLIARQLCVVLKVAEADHFVNVRLGSFQRFRFDTDLFKLAINNLLDFWVLKPLGLVLEQLFGGVLRHKRLQDYFQVLSFFFLILLLLLLLLILFD